MRYEHYVHSNRPLHLSAVLLGIALLLPLSIFATEGWHSGVLYSIGFAFAIGVFIPGIYLLRPLVFYLWAAYSAVVSVSGILVFEYYWRSVPDWMDADIPDALTITIRVLIMLIEVSMFVLGIWGWIHYFKVKSHVTQNA